MTGRKPTEAEVDNMIDTGESETIFQKAILEQGRGHVSPSMPFSYFVVYTPFTAVVLMHVFALCVAVVINSTDCCFLS